MVEVRHMGVRHVHVRQMGVVQVMRNFLEGTLDPIVGVRFVKIASDEVEVVKKLLVSTLAEVGNLLLEIIDADQPSNCLTPEESVSPEKLRTLLPFVLFVISGLPIFEVCEETKLKVTLN